jgi:hypothetical protein
VNGAAVAAGFLSPLNHPCNEPNSTMIKAKTLILAAASLAVFSGSSAFAEMYLRPAAWRADYSASGFAAKIGPALELGTTIESSRQQRIGVEAAYIPWGLNLLTPTLAPTSFLGVVGDGHLTPVIGTYRYQIREASARWNVYIGGSAGVTKVSGRIETRLSGLAYGGDVNHWATTLAGSVGVSAAVTPNVSIDLAYRYLWLDGVDYSTFVFTGVGGFTGPAGPSRSFPATKAHIISLGLTVRL